MWKPQVMDGTSPLYRRLADAIEVDVNEGRLTPGTKLPPHRELAHALAIGIGTVTRGYEEAERRGLIVAHVGRGSFIADPGGDSSHSLDGPFDLATNIAPTAAAGNAFDGAVEYLTRRVNRTSHLAYVSRFGAESARKAGASWLAHHAHLSIPDWTLIACTNGAQHGIALALGVLAKRGHTILCENQTYVGLKAIAAHRGYHLHGIQMDHQGLCPDALGRAVEETGARVLYTLPTLQNPTARVMGNARRKEIARLARKLDLEVIEDDVYSHFAQDVGVEPIANFIPERCWYIGGLSKALSPSLRVGYLIAPDSSKLDRIGIAIQATTLSPPGLNFDIATHLIDSGAANEIVLDVNSEVRSRTALAIETMGSSIEAPCCPASIHVWMPMGALDAERAAGRAMRAGISVMAPSSPTVGADVKTGLRVALGAVSTRAHLETALTRLRAACQHNSEDLDSNLV